MSIMTGICNGCGKKIIWGLTEEGKRIPMDPVPATYVCHGQGEDPVNGQHYRVRRANPNKEKAIGQAYVSHFTTCPKASDFSGNRGR